MKVISISVESTDVTTIVTGALYKSPVNGNSTPIHHGKIQIANNVAATVTLKKGKYSFLFEVNSTGGKLTVLVKDGATEIAKKEIDPGADGFYYHAVDFEVK